MRVFVATVTVSTTIFALREFDRCETRTEVVGARATLQEATEDLTAWLRASGPQRESVKDPHTSYQILVTEVDTDTGPGAVHRFRAVPTVTLVADEPDGDVPS